MKCFRLIGHMTIECEFCDSKVERANRHEHLLLCEKRPLKCARPYCEFESADREVFANHIAGVHREQLVRHYARLFNEDTGGQVIRQRDVSASDFPMINGSAAAAEGLYRQQRMINAYGTAVFFNDFTLLVYRYGMYNMYFISGHVRGNNWYYLHSQYHIITDCRVKELINSQRNLT